MYMRLSKKKRIIYPKKGFKCLTERKADSKGVYAEVLVYKTIKRSKPKNVIDIRFSNKIEDNNGVDVFIVINSKKKKVEIPIQIKSSKRGVNSHKIKNEDNDYIPVILIRRSMKSGTIIWLVRKAIKDYVKSLTTPVKTYQLV